MPLTAEEKAERARERMIQTARQYRPSKYIQKFVAPLYQRMQRAEFAAAAWPYAFAIVDGELYKVRRRIGECVCVTCGKVARWNEGIEGMHAGHFIGGRTNSILFEELNVAPQCSHCNVYLSGNPQAFRKWMIEMHGEETVDRLERLQKQSRKFSVEELVDMRIEFAARLKAAMERMQR